MKFNKEINRLLEALEFDQQNGFTLVRSKDEKFYGFRVL